MSAPDWGHGPNPPVPMYTEAEIRAVMARHFPQPSETMWCAAHDGDFTVDHLLDKLKEQRDEPRLHANFD